MSLQKLIDFGIIPIDSVQVSSNQEGFEFVKMFDGKLDTAWKPAQNQPNNFAQINFLSPHLVKAFDIAFVKGDKRKYTFRVEAQDKDNPSRWIRVNTYETRGTTLEPVRVNIPDVLTKSVRLTFLSFNEQGHMGVLPEVTELRIYGEIEEGEAPGNVKIPDLGCPEGYVLDVGTGRCIKNVSYQILVPDEIIGDAKAGAEGNTDSLLDLATDISYTIKGKGSRVIEKFSKPVNLNAIVLGINNKGLEYTLTVVVPNKVQVPVIIQKGIRETSFMLDETVTTESIELISQNDELEIIDFYGLGDKKTVEVTQPPEPTEGRKREKGANQDATKWKAEAMQTPEGEFTHEVNDENGVQEADQFTSQAKAQEYINYYVWKQTQDGGVVTPPPPPPPPPPVIDPNAKVDAQGVVMIYAPKPGGTIVTKKDTYQKESEHNTGTRTSLYSTIEYKANSGELTEGFIMDLSDSGEQNAPKLLSGGHTGSGDSDTTRQGQCYAVGVNQNGTLHLAKEYPHHPTTPKFYDKITYVNPQWKSLGDIRNKFVLMKIIYFPTTKDGKTGMHLEWWFDKKALETGKLENNWVQMAYADDFGDWKGPPHLENMGVKYKGKVLGFYIRIDTPKKPVKFDYQGQHEIGENPKRLVPIA